MALQNVEIFQAHQSEETSINLVTTSHPKGQLEHATNEKEV